MTEFRTLLAAAARRFAPAAVLTVIGLLGGLGYALLVPPSYTATAYVAVVDRGGDPGGASALGFAQAYGRLAATREILTWSYREVPADLVRDLPEHLQAGTSPDAPLIRLTGSAATARAAARYANTAADALVRYGAAREEATGVGVALMSNAAAPESPSAPSLPLDLAVGAATGLLLGVLVTATARGLRPAPSRPRGEPNVPGPRDDPSPAEPPRKRALSAHQAEHDA